MPLDDPPNLDEILHFVQNKLNRMFIWFNLY
ncbi:MAG: protease modulator HflK N-terminal domain-containing protein [Nitrospinae bacterium]|nr:protease modulator HflK N-terminal domain-containing protein [Nitrospinota bacterium]